MVICKAKIKSRGDLPMYAKISKKGQITIPKAVRQALKVGAKDAVLFFIDNDEVKLKGIPGGTDRNLAGSLSRYSKKYTPLKKVRDQIKGDIAGEVAREGQSARKNLSD